MEVVRNTEPSCCCCCSWPREDRGRRGSRGSRAIFCGSEIVLQLLLLCEYCHYNAYYSEVHQAVMRKSSVLLPFGGFSCLLLLSLWTSSNLRHFEKALLSLVCNTVEQYRISTAAAVASLKWFQTQAFVCLLGFMGLIVLC